MPPFIHNKIIQYIYIIENRAIVIIFPIPLLLSIAFYIIHIYTCLRPVMSQKDIYSHLSYMYMVLLYIHIEYILYMVYTKHIVIVIEFVSAIDDT